ncbi:F-box domain containing protein [Pandoravirus salinus]|uniref:F-box domain containing protein n=1 Tax=Pandoravirus salinus TaxID=1349410 RepID=S4W077_9VIRU|nr:F-box domain [Pandoravirus salinus]AGO85196.1 F-box domain containing protein [Pandoravirus salinus]
MEPPAPTTTLIDLPDDLVLEVISLLPLASVGAVSVACRTLHAVTTCASLWRRLFVRDFGSLYQKGLPAEPWAHLHHPDDPWDEIAVELWTDTDALARMPPRCRPLAHLPAPFAHAFAAGKDWLWLYRVHAAKVLKGKPDDSFSGPVAFMDSWRCLTRCDWDRGRPRGYAVKLWNAITDDEIDSWVEQMHHPEDGSVLWKVACDNKAVHHHASLGRHGNFCERIFHRDGRRIWLTFHAHRLAAEVEVSNAGTRRDYHYENGTMTSMTNHRIDGRFIVPICNDERHGIAQSLWHNGDVMTVGYKKGRFVEVIEFVCSPTCRRPEYAGKKISGCAWRIVRVTTAGEEYHVQVPADDSEAARLFWRYVTDGLVGWHPDLRRIVLDATSTDSI